MKKLLSLISLSICLQISAQEEKQELDAVTVTASLQARKISQTGRNIIYLKGDAFNQFPIQSIDELLRYLPGMEVQMRGPLGSQSDIVLRGGTFQQVLVLLDGVRINDPNTGHFNSYIPISPAEIDHVEILKGASSAIYGSEAVGGVVHIITKTFAARPAQNKLQAQARVAAGEHGLLNSNAGLFYQHNNTAIGAGFIGNNTDGQLQRGTRGFAHNNTATISISHFFNSKLQLSFRTAYDNRDFGAQNFYTTFLSDTASEKVRSFWNQVRLSYTTASHRISLDAGYKSVRDEYLFNKSSIANLNKSKLWQATLQDEWKIRPTTTLTSGIQVLDKGIRSNDRGDHHLLQLAGFLVLNQSIGDHFTFNPAIRVDHNERSGTEIVPQANLSYKIDRLQLRASAGKTIRDADFTERFNNYNKPIVASGRIGDPDLEAERSFSYEAGADYFLRQGVKISASFFQRFHKRLIDYVPTPYADMPRKDNLVVGGTYALAKNISKVNTTGIELDVQLNHHFSERSSIYGGAGLVWLNSKSSNAIPSFYVSSHARFLTNFFADWTNRLFSISINGIYKERSQQQAAAIHANISRDYWVLNAKAAVFVWKDKINAFVQLDNVFNENYSDLLGAVMPGRWLSGGLSWRL